MQEETLVVKMRKFASAYPDLSDLADKLESAIECGDAKQLLGAWARARLRWCEITGDSLI